MIDKQTQNTGLSRDIDYLVCTLADEYKIPPPSYEINRENHASSYQYRRHSMSIGILKAPESWEENIRHEMLHAAQAKYKTAAIFATGNQTEIERCVPELRAAVATQRLHEDPLAVSLGHRLLKSSLESHQLRLYAEVFQSPAHHKEYEDTMIEVPARMDSLEYRLNVLKEQIRNLDNSTEPTNKIESFVNKVRKVYLGLTLNRQYSRTQQEYSRLLNLVEEHWSESASK